MDSNPSNHNKIFLIIYIISIYGTEKAFTVDGDWLRVNKYTGANTQLWKCVKDDHNRFSFINVATGKYLGRDVYQNLRCSASSQGTWECITLRARPGGGYCLSADIDGRICPTLLASDSKGEYMRVVAESDTIIGLHQTEPEIFRRFLWVVNGPGERPLARSSAPNYNDDIGEDNTQSMDDAAVQFLVARGITNVISMNRVPLSDKEKKRLSDHGISYTHLPVPDFQPPSLSQLLDAQNSYTSHSSTLVYCGYGHGRTGTVISALQLYRGQDRTRGDYKANEVETEDQMKVLDKLREDLGFHKRN